MNKLKTLKNLEIWELRRYFDSGQRLFKTFEHGYSESDLRQEAIKWIKELDYAMRHEGKRMPEALCPFSHIKDWQGHTGSIIVFIRYFFNITEEELK